ncbi:coniferyl aldehyde dehydrogenase [Palleronia caenipelagi]|uniref:Aldehyde dehydrogenase n=1 Tax=Palleronia caenipelagi TaxID=2489174 RepID=A0A547PNI6_9RHOB|nr:coniferyl aldehyde dehydrogenase [Palleronia caenipelagi]TRD15675.1 coniferyl aldehyde dehydrogenase [Palleronia caenipelagi]
MKDTLETERSAATTKDEMRRRFDRMHAETRSGAVVSAEQRLDRLDRLRKMLVDNEKAFVEAISNDFGHRSTHESRMLDIVLTLNAIRASTKGLRKWMKPSRRHVDLPFKPGKNWVRYEPLGVIGIMSPWNYPLFLSLGPLVDVLAAGNRAMLKPSSQTARTSALLAELIAQTFDESEVTVVTGDHDISDAFSDLPFDHLVFTGSEAIRKRIMSSAAKNLTPVTLELGGKSPVIVAGDFDVKDAARSISFGKYLNSGQTCIAPDYALVPREKVEEFAKAMIDHANEKYPNAATNDDYTSIISQKAFDRLTGALEKARRGGARVMQVADDGSAAGRRKIPPTVVLDAPEKSELLTKEIFGPILPVLPYDSLDEVARYINDRPRPLALYAFSNDQSVLDGIMDRSISGGVTLNATMIHPTQESMAFGGVGSSGIGGYHGHEGFKRFSHARSVHKIGFINGLEKLGPPWGDLADRAIKFLKNRS